MNTKLRSKSNSLQIPHYPRSRERKLAQQDCLWSRVTAPLLSLTRTCDFSYRQRKYQVSYCVLHPAICYLVVATVFYKWKQFKEISYLCLKYGKHAFAQVISWSCPQNKNRFHFFFFCPRQVHVEKRILWRTKDQGINCCSVHSTKLTKANQLQVIISDGVTERVPGLYCTVSYGPGFFPLIYGPSAKKRQGSITYSKAWENDVSKIFIISPRINFEI